MDSNMECMCIGENVVMDDKRIFNNLEQLFCKICNNVNLCKKSHNTELRDRIMEYIGTKYMDPNMCISNAASDFNLSESYFSQFFKEQIGEPFSNYIERIRIQKACNMISDKEENIIEQIAYKVGYNSAYSFRRAFKKVTGVSPSMYKITVNNVG
jgi:YesN/AraC family two-component response regulator